MTEQAAAPQTARGISSLETGFDPGAGHVQALISSGAIRLVAAGRP